MFFGDLDGALPAPEDMGSDLITATDEVVAVGTQVGADGPTNFSIGVDGQDDEPQGAPAADVRLRLGDQRLVAFDSEGAVHAKVDGLLPVDARCRIWVNHESEPDLIEVMIG